jgi:Rieske Fe-S protein
MNRRTFLIVLGSTAAALAGDDAAAAGATADPTVDATTLDAGPLDSFEQDKVYDQFRDQGVLLIRRGDEVFALSPICTHRGCKVRPQDDASFLCKCHQSRFDPGGKVLNGPARTDLLRLKVKLSAENHVLVRVVKPTIMG